MKKITILLFVLLLSLPMLAIGVGGSGMFQWSVELRGYVSKETGKAPVAYLWIPEGCKKVKATILCQQNMTEETIFKMPSFQRHMKKLEVAVIWVAPSFTNTWDPQTNCQGVFLEMMTGLAAQSGHAEIEHGAIIPLGHSAQATFPWNFAAWNNDRTLCIISFHGDAPRTNLCGYGTANVEWGRSRNIDGIPGLMIVGEYEWWEARVNPALAFRMMYPESCISFLCDTGRGHFDCSQETADYIAVFIEKSLRYRMQANGTLQKLNPKKGKFFHRFVPDLPQTDRGATTFSSPADYGCEEPCTHNSFWYFDQEMVDLTARRYASTKGKKIQYVGVEQNGKLLPYDEKLQGGMTAEFLPEKDGLTMKLKAVLTDSTHQRPIASRGRNRGRLSVETICGPVCKINDTTFRICPYEAGWDNPRRSFRIWLVAVAQGDSQYKSAVQPFYIDLPRDIILRLNQFYSFENQHE